MSIKHLFFLFQWSVFALAFSVCGRWLASGGGGCGVGEVRVWDVASGAPAQHALPPAHAAPVHALAFSRDGTILASGEPSLYRPFISFGALECLDRSDNNISSLQ